MDPFSLTLGVITLSTALKDIIEVGERIHNSFARVSKNLHHAQSLAQEIKSTIYQLKGVCEEHEDALKNAIGMRQALGDLLSKLHVFEMNTVPLIPAPGGGSMGRFKSRVAGWMHGKEIEDRILELKDCVNECHSRFTTFSVIRIEAKLESIQRTTTQGIQLMERRTLALESVAAPSDNCNRAQLTSNKVPFQHPSPLNRVRVANEGVAGNREVARNYLSCQIKSITQWFIVKALPAFLNISEDQWGPGSALKVMLSGISSTESYAPIVQPLFGANWHRLHRYAVISALRIRSSLDEHRNQLILPAIVRDVAFKLPSLCTLLHHLDMVEEAGDIANWAVTVFRAFQSVCPSVISPRLIYCLSSLSNLRDTTGDKGGAYLAMGEALFVSKELQITTSLPTTPIAIRVQYCEVMTGYARILARNTGDYAKALKFAASAVEIMESILGLTPIDLSHDIVDGHVRPLQSFIDALAQKEVDMHPVFVYAQALRMRSYFCGSADTTVGSLGDTLRAMIIFQHLQTSREAMTLPQLSDTLYDIISHPDKKLLSPEQLLVYTRKCVTLYRRRMHFDSSKVSRNFLGALQLRSELLYELRRKSEMVESWREYVVVALDTLEGDLFANALSTVATSLRRVKMPSASVSIQTQSAEVFERMRTAGLYAQAKWDFALFLDFLAAGHKKEAEMAARRSVHKYRALEGTNPGRWSASIARGLSALALCLLIMGNYEDALRDCNEALIIFEQYPDQKRVVNMYKRTCKIRTLVLATSGKHKPGRSLGL